MKQSSRYLRGLQDEVMDNDLLLVGEAQSVLTNERDGEGDAVHGLFPTWPVNKFILSLWRTNSELNEVCCGHIYSSELITEHLFIYTSL